MKIQGQRSFDVPRPVAWRALLDPAVLSRTLPGCDNLQAVGEHEFKGELNVRVGPVEGRFAGTVKLTDVEPERGFHMRIDGAGPHGFTKAEGRIELKDDGSATTIHYDLDAQVGGRIASLGQRLLDSSARLIVKQALDGLAPQLNALAQAERAGGAVERPAAATQRDFAVGLAKGLAREHRGLLITIGLVVLALLASIVTWMALR